MMGDLSKKILIVASGMSPAVLTETVWALATGKPSVVPDEIVVLTTLTGKRAIEQQILNGDDSVWLRMCNELEKKRIRIKGKLNFGASSSILVFSNGSKDLADITTPEENTIAADFILKTIRAYSENPSTQIYTSIAGGRKTMSALMLSCMSLLAREQDHVLHVLVNEPFDGAVEPRFYFPDGGVYVRRNTSEQFPSSSAKIDLIDLPFVKVRSLYEGRFGKRVPSYEELVRGAQTSAALTRPTIKLDFAKGNVFINDELLKLSATELVVLGVVLCKRPNSMIALHKQMCELRKCALIETADWSQSWLEKFSEGSRFKNDDDISDSSKVLSSLRDKLRKVAAVVPFIEEIVPKRLDSVLYPEEKISADIRILQHQFK